MAVLFPQRAAVRHAIWLAAVVASVVTPLVSGLLPHFRLSVPATFSAGPLATASGTSTAVDRNIVDSEVPFELDALSGAYAPSPRRAGWPRYVLALWLIGGLIVVARLVSSHRRAWQLVRASRPETSPRLLSEYADSARHHGIRLPVKVRITDALSSAATIGWMRPVILLPCDAKHWPQGRARAVLMHELAHVARRDCLTQLVSQLACALYWFNPMIWLAARHIAAESELACDDLVVGLGVSRTAYATVLLDAARRSTRDSPRFGAPLLTLASTGGLETRVRRILHSPSTAARLGWIARAGIATACAVVALLVGSVRIGNAQGSPAQPRAGEPDLLGDSVAPPTSERISEVVSLDSALLRAALEGPDSALAANLAQGLKRQPIWKGDLVRDRATWALSQTSNGRLVESLIASLRNPDWRIRAYAAWALSYARDRRATPALVGQLTHPVWRVRAMAAYALAASGDPAARPAMIAIVLDPAWQVRSSVVAYLGGQGDSSLVSIVRDRLSDRHVVVRSAAAGALSRF
jgi:beta-lactamase regulating signal transducer with metallopeptidase domain